MIKKELLSLIDEEEKKYILGGVVYKWLCLLCKITITAGMVGLIVRCAISLINNESIITATDYIKYIIPILLGIGLHFIFGIKEKNADYFTCKNIKEKLRSKIYNKICELGPSYTKHISTAKVTLLITDNVEKIGDYLGSFLSQIIFSIIAPITLFFVLFPICTKAAILLLIFAFLIPVFTVWIHKISKNLLKDHLDSYDKLSDNFLDSLQGLTTLKMYNADEIYLKKIDNNSSDLRKKTMKVLSMQLNITFITDLFFYVSSAIGIIIALNEYFSGKLDMPGTLLIIILSAEFFIPMKKNTSVFCETANALEQACDILSFLSANGDSSGTKSFPKDNISITFENVKFKYNDNQDKNDITDSTLWPNDCTENLGLINKEKEKKEVLKGVSLEFNKNSLTSIVGISGSGKSTIASILMGYENDYKGSIKVGNIELKDIKRSEILSNITLVSTNEILFEASLRENLLIAKKNANDEELLKVLKIVGITKIHDFEGEQLLNIEIKQNAKNLSAGQAQQIALARAILKNTSIYIFDEATSNIDAESEEIIINVIKKLSKIKTVIMISHRLSNVVDSDNIYMLKDGLVAESGKHKELMKHFGTYAILFDAQKKLENFGNNKNSLEEIPLNTKFLENKTSALENLKLKNLIALKSSKDEGKNLNNSKNSNNEKVSSEQNIKIDSKNQGKKIIFNSIFSLIKILNELKELLPAMLVSIFLATAGFLCAIFIYINASKIMTGYGIKNENITFGIFFCLILLSIFNAVLHYAGQYLSNYIAFKTLEVIRHKIFDTLRKLAPAKLDKKDRRNIFSILTSDIENLEIFYTHMLPHAIIALAISIIMIVFEWKIYFAAGIIAAISYVFVGIVIPFINVYANQNKGQIYKDSFESLNSFLIENIQAIKQIVQYKNEKEKKKILNLKTQNLTDLSQKEAKFKALQLEVTNVIIWIFAFMLLIILIKETLKGNLSFAKTIVAVVALLCSFEPLTDICDIQRDMNMTLASAKKVTDLMCEEPIIEENTTGIENISDIEKAFANKITFSYDEKNIFENLSLSFNKGSITGISGSSGCGKSTLLKLFMRFYDVKSGSINFFSEKIDKNMDSSEIADKKEESVSENNLDKESKSSMYENIESDNNNINAGLNEKNNIANNNTNDANDKNNENNSQSNVNENKSKPLTAMDILKQMQKQKEDKEKQKIEHENELERRLVELTKQKEEQRLKSLKDAAVKEKNKKLTARQRLLDLYPSDEEVALSANVTKINSKVLRNLESLVTKDAYLFNDTIAENIRIGKYDASMDEIIAAAKKASIHDFIMSLPNAYETSVGELGSSLSSGEKQRIALARSFLSDSDIIFLDEPTSLLDSLNEGLILKSLQKEKENKIIVLVSHKKSALGIADNVYNMNS